MVSTKSFNRSESNDDYRISVFGNNKIRDEFIARIIHETFILHMKYIQVFENEDAIFDYTEMSNVGVMATASWNLGWPAIIEYQAEKYSGETDRENNSKSYKWGRADLYICNVDYEFICEAKLVFSQDGNLDNKTVISKIVGAYDDTKNSIRCHYDDRENEKNNGHYEGYAITFISHRCTIGKSQKDIEKKVIDFTSSLIERNLQAPSYLKKGQKHALMLDGAGHIFLKNPIQEEEEYELHGLSVLFKRVDII